MGSLRDFQWALFGKLQEVERKDQEIAELRKAAAVKDRQLAEMKTEVRILRETVLRVPMVVPSPVSSASSSPPVTRSTTMTVAANIVVSRLRKKDAPKQRVAISAEPIGDQFTVATILTHFPKNSMYVGGMQRIIVDFLFLCPKFLKIFATLWLYFILLDNNIQFWIVKINLVCRSFALELCLCITLCIDWFDFMILLEYVSAQNVLFFLEIFSKIEKFWIEKFISGFSALILVMDG